MEGQTERELEKMWQGTMRSEGKRPRTTPVIDPPLHDSLRRELIHSWWSDKVVMALAAAGGGDRTLSDASLSFHSNFADRDSERHHSRNITWAQPLFMPSAHVAHAPIAYCTDDFAENNSTSRSRFFGRTSAVYDRK